MRRLVSLLALAVLLLQSAVADGRDRVGRRKRESARPPELETGARRDAAPPAPAPAPEYSPELPELVAQLVPDATRATARARIIGIGKAATPYLLTRMKDPDFTIRWEMANVQGDIQDPRAVPALVENVLHDVDPHVRWRSIWALNEYPDDSATLKLLHEALASTDETTRWNAAVGLSMFAQPECLPVIHAGLTQEDDWRRWEAINALGHVFDDSSAGLLEPIALRSEDPKERMEAVMSLGNVGGPQSVDILVAALADPDPGVRWRAVMQLGTIDDVRAMPALEKLAAVETDAMVTDHLAKVLTRWRERSN